MTKLRRKVKNLIQRPRDPDLIIGTSYPGGGHVFKKVKVGLQYTNCCSRPYRRAGEAIATCQHSTFVYTQFGV
jgi:hypothetical protein